jgi:hypothetical protein
MPTLREARQSVLAEAVIQFEEQLASPIMTARPSTIATGLARLHACTGLSSGEIQARVDAYAAVRQEYFALYPDGSLQQLWDSLDAIIALYDEARYQACVRGLPPGNFPLRDIVTAVISQPDDSELIVHDFQDGKGLRLAVASKA